MNPGRCHDEVGDTPHSVVGTCCQVSRLSGRRGSSRPTPIPIADIPLKAAKFFSFPVSSLFSHILVLKYFRLTVSSTSFLLLEHVCAVLVNLLEFGYAI
jgi:hypothetical protein